MVLRVGQGRWLGMPRPGIRISEEEAAPVATFFLLLEDGDNLLLENGDDFLTEAA